MLLKDNTVGKNVQPRTPMFRSFSSSSISLKTLSFVKSVTITLTLCPVVSPEMTGKENCGGSNVFDTVHSSKSSNMCSCNPKTDISDVFTYFLGHLVQSFSGSADDDNIHSLLSQLGEAEVQWEAGRRQKECANS